MTVGHDFAFEAQLLRPLPTEPFETALTLTPRVDRYAQVMVRCSHYSVPARLIGRRVRVELSACAVTVFDGGTVVARHERAAGQGGQVLDAGPLPGDPAAQARRAARGDRAGPGPGVRGVHRRRTRRSGPPPARHSVTAGTRVLVEVLLLHRHLEHADVLAGISAALAVGSVNATWSRSRPARPRSGGRRAPPAQAPHLPGAGGQPDRAAPGRPAPAMTGRCPRSPPTTTYSGKASSHDRNHVADPADPGAGVTEQAAVAAIDSGTPAAAPAHHARPVRRDRRRGRT